MSRSKSELSVTERLIIQLVKFRINAKHPTFYGDNKNIAQCLDIQPDTARKAVSKLVKLGYLEVGFDKQGRRHMVYTGKEFAPIIENMNNVDKKVLRDDKEYYEREAQYSAHELESAKIRIETLERENSELQNKLFYSELRVSQLENLFLSKGCPRDYIDTLIKENQEMQEAAKFIPVLQ